MLRPRHRIERFVENPASIRFATTAIMSVTVVVVLLGAVVIRLFDREEYPSFGEAIWFTLQTVTTVGYGDSTPENLVGRVVAGIVMVVGIGLITVVTASITSVFVQAARTRFRKTDQTDTSASLARLEASLDTIASRLERLESALGTDHDESATSTEEQR